MQELRKKISVYELENVIDTEFGSNYTVIYDSVNQPDVKRSVPKMSLKFDKIYIDKQSSPSIIISGECGYITLSSVSGIYSYTNTLGFVCDIVCTGYVNMVEVKQIHTIIIQKHK